MAASGFTPISLYYSTTPTAEPVNTDLVRGELALNITDGKLYYKDDANIVQLLAEKGGNGVSTFSGGSTGLTPNTPTIGDVVLGGILNQVNGGTGFGAYTTGDILYASATDILSKLPATTDGYILSLASGVPAWVPAPPSGANITNDTTTAAELYPLFSDATTGAPTTIYTSDPKYLYNPSTGELQANEVVASNGFLVNSDSVASDYTVGTGFNAVSVGPVTVQSGISVTVSSGQRWVVL